MLPEILIEHIASATSRIRVGSGGIMLPNHAPLRIAEAFHTLETLHPGRIDFGVGRAPGTDPVTSRAMHPFDAEQFPATAAGGARLVARSLPPDHPFHTVRVVPSGVGSRRSGSWDRAAPAHASPARSASATPLRATSAPLRRSRRSRLPEASRPRRCSPSRTSSSASR